MAVGVAATLLLSACVGSQCDWDPCPPGKGWVSALDEAGAERWRTEVADRSETPPLVTGDHVLVTGCRAVHVLDAATGRLLLSTEEIEDTVGIADGMVWGRDARDDDHPGRAVRGVPLSGTGGQSIAHAGGSNGEAGDFARTFTISGDRLIGSHGDVLSVHPAGGGPDRWVQLPVRATARFVPVGDDRAVTASRDGSVLGVDLEGPRLAWRVVPEQVATSFAVHLEVVGDTVLVSASGSDQLGRVEEVFAVSAGTGRVLWRRKGASLASLGAGVAALASAGATVVVDLVTGRELWSVSSGSTAAGRLGLATVSAGGEHSIADRTLVLSGTDLQGQQVTLGVDVRNGRERWRLEGLRQPVALDGLFGVDAWEGRAAQDSRRWLGVVEAGSGRQLWQHQMRAEQYGESQPAEHLAADPARGQTVVADLPSVPHGGCY